MTWVQTGVDHYAYHEENKDGLCPFCRQELPKDFKQDIADLFNEDYARNMTSLNAYLNSFKQTLSSLYLSLRELAKNPFPAVSTSALNTQIETLGTVTQECLNTIREKIANPSGFKKIIEDYQFQHNYPEELAPALRLEHGSFFLTLKNLNYYQNSITTIDGGINGEINAGINLSETENQILAAIIKNPHITRSDLADSLGFGTSTIDRTIKKLKDMDILTRIGSNKSGYWDVQKM